jgi:manganese transport protein
VEVVAAPVNGRRMHRLVSLAGPAFVAAVAYVDPGNVATNVTAGSRYAYRLVWVVVLANLLAVLTQYLAAKLGIATGRTLPELCRDRFPRPVALLLWAQAEAVALATDVAEVLGGAIGLDLLFGLPLPAGAVLTGLASFVILSVQNRRGQRTFERQVALLLGLVVLGFGWTAVAGRPDPGGLAAGLLPAFPDGDSVLLTAAIVGATIMPHAIYLHTGLIRDRFGVTRDPGRKRLLLRATRRDVTAAMALAGAANVMLVAAAAGALGGTGIDTIQGAFAGFQQRLGTVVAVFFGAALLVSGLVSSSVGTYAGSVILGGFTRLAVPPQVRRLITIVPAVLVPLLGADPTAALVLSQVVLGLGIPFALWPLVAFTARRELMGELVNRRATTLAAGATALAVTVLGIATLFA